MVTAVISWILIGDVFLIFSVILLSAVVAVEIIAVEALAGIAFNVIALLVTASTVAIALEFLLNIARVYSVSTGTPEERLSRSTASIGTLLSSSFRVQHKPNPNPNPHLNPEPLALNPGPLTPNPNPDHAHLPAHSLL